MPSTIEKTVATYGAAWLETDPDKRATLLNAAWAESGTYKDPRNTANGRQELNALIAGFQAGSGGARIELTSKPLTHNNHVYFTWQRVTAEGKVTNSGVDFGTLDAEGKLAQIVGFFGAPEPL